MPEQSIPGFDRPVLEKAEKIRLLALDVDGVLQDTQQT